MKWAGQPTSAGDTTSCRPQPRPTTITLDPHCWSESAMKLPPKNRRSLVVLYKECYSPGKIVMADEILDGADVMGQLFGEGERVTHQPRDARS